MRAYSGLAVLRRVLQRRERRYDSYKYNEIFDLKVTSNHPSVYNYYVPVQAYTRVASVYLLVIEPCYCPNT